MHNYDDPHRLLQPGFAGILSLEDATYIKQKLDASESLKRKWNIRGALNLIKIAAAAYPEDSKFAKRHMRQEIMKERRRNARKRKNSSKTISGKKDVS